MIAEPLKGVTVLDFGQVYNGPYCGYLLAQAGARVIKVESLIGETLRARGGASYPFVMLNANKESTFARSIGKFWYSLRHRVSIFSFQFVCIIFCFSMSSSIIGGFMPASARGLNISTVRSSGDSFRIGSKT